jgi:SAM-dependent methyltransferase
MECVACISKDLIPIYNVKGLKVFMCNTCGTGNVEENSLYKDKQLYQDDYYKPFVFPKLTAQLKRVFLFNKRIAVIEKYCKGGSVLDFGCGDGAFISTFTKSLWKRYGYDSNKKTAELLSSKNIVFWDFNSKESKETSKFDVVTCIHVLEHLEKPGGYLTRISDKTKTGGFLLIEVPNFTSFWSKVFKENWPPNADVPRHLTHFSPEGLITLLNNSGYELVKKVGSPISDLLFTCYIFSVLFKSKVTNKLLVLGGTLVLTPLIFLIQVLGHRDSIEILFKKK